MLNLADKNPEMLMEILHEIIFFTILSFKFKGTYYTQVYIICK